MTAEHKESEMLWCAECRFSAVCLPIGVEKLSERMIVCMECEDVFWGVDEEEIVNLPGNCDALSGLLLSRGADEWRCGYCVAMERRRRQGW